MGVTLEMSKYLVFLLMALFVGSASVTHAAAGRIAFMSNRDGGWGIYTANVDGSGQTRLSSTGSLDLYPAFSPDGSRIVFESRRNGYQAVWLMDSNGSNQMPLTPMGSDNSAPTFSPDGTKIAFISNRSGEYCLYVMDAAPESSTNPAIRLTSTFRSSDPSFSPDGTKIVFDSIRSGYRQIYLMNAAPESVSNPAVQLTFTPENKWVPRFSPDGSKITFDTSGAVNAEVYMMNVDGSNVVNLTNSPGADGNAFWSPDGSQIMFQSDRTGDTEIYLMDADGSNSVNVTQTPGYDAFPSWVGVSHAPVLSLLDSSSQVIQGNLLTFTTSAVDADPGDTLTYSLIDAPAGATIDANSGVFAWTPSQIQGTGTYTFTVRVTDSTGLTDEQEVTVVVTYAWSAIFQPINPDGSSVFKAGSTVQVKFQLTGASAGNATLVATLSYALVSNGDPGAVNEAASTSAATTGNQFRYDAASDQYLFNWSTKGMPAGKYRLYIDLGDGVTRSVDLGLR